MAAKKKSASRAMEMAEIRERFGITLREARDIATAVSNAAVAKGSKATRKNLKKQVKEVGTAVTKGEVGTTAGKVKNGKFESGKYRDYPRTYNVVDKNKKSKKPASIRKIREL
jgi:hypothetical protein